MNRTIKHIFFDLDHTLWDFDRNSALAFEIIFTEMFPQVNINDFMQVYVPINQECWRLYQTDKISHNELRYNRLKLSFDVIGKSISNEQIDVISDKYLELLPENNHLFDGTIEVLDYLKKHYTLHIITNGFAKVQALKMKNSGLENYFQTVTNSEMAGCKKPNAAIFETALQVAGAQKYNSVMIGDSWDADVQGALHFGIEAIYFNPEKVPIVDHSMHQSVMKPTEIVSLLDLKQIL